MGRRKFQLGHVQKNAKKQRQAVGVNKCGRPKKNRKNQLENSCQLAKSVADNAKPTVQVSSPQSPPTCPKCIMPYEAPP